MATPKSHNWLMYDIKEGNVLFNDTQHIFIYGYFASDIWLRTTQGKLAAAI